MASGRHDVSPGQIILLPLLFTAGMSAVDSLDSVFMLSAYTIPARAHAHPHKNNNSERVKWWRRKKFPNVWEKRQDKMQVLEDEKEMRFLMAQDQDKLLSMSVVLTVISIVVALLISIVRTSVYFSLSIMFFFPFHGEIDTLKNVANVCILSRVTDRVHGVRSSFSFCSISLVVSELPRARRFDDSSLTHGPLSRHPGIDSLWKNVNPAQTQQRTTRDYVSLTRPYFAPFHPFPSSLSPSHSLRDLLSRAIADS